MSRLECVGRSSKAKSHKLAPEEMSPSCTKTTSPQGNVTLVTESAGEKPLGDYSRESQPLTKVSPSVKNDSTVKRKVICAGEAAPEEPIESRSSTGIHAEATVFSSQTMNLKENNNTKKSDSTKSEPLPSLETEGKHTEDEEEDDGYQAPLELMAEFLKAVMDKDFLLAEKLCQMILIYEPENPEASQFLLLIKEKLRDQAENQSEDDEDDSNSSDDDDSEDSRSEGKSAQSSGCSSTSSSSSSSSSEEEEEEERQGRRHKPCPPSHLPP